MQPVPAEQYRRIVKVEDKFLTYMSAADQPEPLCPCTRTLVANSRREEG